MKVLERLLERLKGVSRHEEVPVESAALSQMRPLIKYSADVSNLSKQSIVYWEDVFTAGLEANPKEWLALNRIWQMYKDNLFEEGLALGRAVEDMADMYPRGYDKYMEEQDSKGRYPSSEIRIPHLPTLYRHQAEKLVGEVPHRIAKLNRDDLMLLRVSKAAVLGSYLDRERLRLRDIDLAIEFQPRDSARLPEWNRVKDGIDKISVSRRKEMNILEALTSEEEYWLNAKLECLSFLQRLGEHFDIADMSWLETFKFAHELIDFTSVDR